MSTLFGIGLGAFADSAVDTYKTVSSVNQKWHEGDRDERRVKIAENADKRAAASAAATARSLSEQRAATAAEFGGPAGSAPATSALAPEAPVGTAPVTSDDTIPAGDLATRPADVTITPRGAAAASAAPADPSPMEGSDSITGAVGDDKRGAARTSGTISGTEISRSGTSGPDAAERRLEELARGGSVAAGSRLREMRKAKEDRADKERTFALESEYKKALTRNARLLGDEKSYELSRKHAEEGARALYAGVETAFKDRGGDEALVNPADVNAASRLLEEAREATGRIPDRRKMDFKKATDGPGFDVTYTSYTGDKHTERIATIGDMRKKAAELGMITNPKLHNEYLGTVARTDYIKAITRDAAELEKADGESALKAKDTMIKFNAAFKDKRAMMENPEAIKALAGELTRLDPKRALVTEEYELTDEDGKKTGKTGKRTRNVWEEMIAREMPAESVTIAAKKKGDKPDTLHWTDVVKSDVPEIKKALEAGKTEQQAREALLKSYMLQKWPPARAAYMADKVFEAIKSSLPGRPTSSIVLPSAVESSRPATSITDRYPVSRPPMPSAVGTTLRSDGEAISP